MQFGQVLKVEQETNEQGQTYWMLRLEDTINKDLNHLVVPNITELMATLKSIMES